MLKQFLSHLNALVPVTADRKVLLAVSGGMDSMVMLHLFREAKADIAVAHCNFELRGEASDADEKLVEGFCKEVGVPFFVRHFNTGKYAADKKVSIQMAARDLRYEWFSKLMDEYAFTAIATAHHGSDVVETVLFNLVRGTGISGVTGIPERTGNIIRPLLFASKDQLIEYATNNSVPWRLDESNETDPYQRNFIRHHVMPLLREINPSVEDSVLTSVERFAGARSMMSEFIEGFKKDAMEIGNKRMSIQRRKLLSVKNPDVLLWEIVKEFGYSFETCKEILYAHQSGKQFVANNHQLTIDRELLIIETIVSKDQEVIQIVREDKEVIKFNKKLSLHWSTLTRDLYKADPEVAWFDGGRLKFPLSWRLWQDGDTFVPFGMTHHKKVSDFLIDLKIPRPEKDRVTVLLSENTIVWVVGFRIADGVKVTKTTNEVLQIEALPPTTNS